MSNYAPMSDDEFDPANLDPGIRATVLWLRERGFKTCDSGDGKTKIEAGYNDVPEGEPAPAPGEVCCEALPVAAPCRCASRSGCRAGPRQRQDRSGHVLPDPGQRDH